MKSLYILIVFSIGIGFVLGRSSELYVPFIDFTFQKNDLTTYIWFALVSAVTVLILSAKIENRRLKFK